MRNLILKLLQKIGEVIEIPIAQLDGYGLESNQTPSRLKIMRQVRPIAYLKASTGNIEDMPEGGGGHPWGDMHFVSDNRVGSGAGETFEITPASDKIWWLYLVSIFQNTGAAVVVLADITDGSDYAYFRESNGLSAPNNRWSQVLPAYYNNYTPCWTSPFPVTDDFTFRVITGAIGAGKSCKLGYVYMEEDKA